MKNLLVTAILALAPVPTLALSPLADAPKEMVDMDKVDTSYLEEALVSLEEEMKALKSKYPDRLEMPAPVQAELAELAHQYDMMDRVLHYRLHTSAIRQPARGLASDSQPRRPAANGAVEHVNGTCPFVAESLSRAGNLREGGIRWKENGRLELKNSIPSTNAGNSQVLTLHGQNLSFRQPGAGERNQVKLDFSEEGKLRKLEVEQKNANSRWSQAMEFDWNGDQCLLNRVAVTSPLLLAGGTYSGVSFDRGICQALEAKGLLDEKKIGECTDFNDSIGATMDKTMRDWKPGQHFTLFVTNPSGTTRLEPWKRNSHLSVNANIARDCAFHLKGGKAVPVTGSGNSGPEGSAPVLPAQ